LNQGDREQDPFEPDELPEEQHEPDYDDIGD
jgi:hypothetical protein